MQRTEADISTLITWLVIGGIAGWLASVALRVEGQHAILVNIVAGVVGAFAGATFFGGTVYAMLGSALLLVATAFVRHASTR